MNEIISILDILKQICEKTPREINDEFLKKITDEINQYYKNSEVGRHSYAEVSAYLYSIPEGDQEYLRDNLKAVYDYYKKNNNDDGKKNVFKLLDHIELELNREVKIQEDYIETVSGSISGVVESTLQTSMKKIEEKEKELNILINNQKNKIENIQNNIISILGIFSGIILAFFGGLSILGSSLENMHQVSKYRISFIVILICFFMFNIIFVLLYSISKLADKDISIKCKREKCKNCKVRPSWKCLKDKFPVVFWFNCICIFLMFSLFSLYIIDYYNVITYFINLKKIKDSEVSIPIFIANVIYEKSFLIICILLIPLIYKYRNAVKVKDMNQQEEKQLGENNIQKIKNKGIEYKEEKINKK